MKIILVDLQDNEAMKTKIQNSLENTKFQWRTIESLENETSYSAKQIEKILNALIKEHKVIKIASPIDDRIGYTTINHYAKTHNFAQVLVSGATGSFSY